MTRSDRAGLQNTVQLFESHRQLNARYCYPQPLCQTVIMRGLSFGGALHFVVQTAKLSVL